MLRDAPGANSGVGYAATKVLANASSAFHVIMTGRDLTKVQTALAEIEKDGIKGSLSAIHLDVNDEHTIAQASKLVREKHGRLDVLINNAAVGSRHPDVRTRMQACMMTNVVGPTVVAEYFRPLLLHSQNPYSIYVSSGAGSLSRTAQGTMAAYSLSYEEAYRASKAALNMIAVLEHRDYSAQGLKVFTMSPGFVVSNLRGTDEDARNGWGMDAGDPMVAGQTLLSLIKGERDADAGKFVHKDGVHPW